MNNSALTFGPSVNAWLLFSRDQLRVPADQVPGDSVCVLVSSGRRGVDLDIVNRAVVDVLVLPTGPPLVAVGSPVLPLLQDVEVTADANVAQAVAAEDREGIGYAVGMAVGQHPVDDEVKTLVGEASDGPMEGPVHRNGKAATSNVVRKVREEAVGLDVQEGPPREREPPLECPRQRRFARAGGAV